MINFEEELKKFRPSLEVDQAEDKIYKNDLRDATDLVEDIIAELRRTSSLHDKEN